MESKSIVAITDNSLTLKPKHSIYCFPTLTTLSESLIMVICQCSIWSN